MLRMSSRNDVLPTLCDISCNNTPVLTYRCVLVWVEYRPRGVTVATWGTGAPHWFRSQWSICVAWWYFFFLVSCTVQRIDREAEWPIRSPTWVYRFLELPESQFKWNLLWTTCVCEKLLMEVGIPHVPLAGRWKWASLPECQLPLDTLLTGIFHEKSVCSPNICL